MRKSYRELSRRETVPPLRVYLSPSGIPSARSVPPRGDRPSASVRAEGHCRSKSICTGYPTSRSRKLTAQPYGHFAKPDSLSPSASRRQYRRFQSALPVKLPGQPAGLPAVTFLWSLPGGRDRHRLLGGLDFHEMLKQAFPDAVMLPWFVARTYRSRRAVVAPCDLASSRSRRRAPMAGRFRAGVIPEAQRRRVRRSRTARSSSAPRQRPSNQPVARRRSPYTLSFFLIYPKQDRSVRSRCRSPTPWRDVSEWVRDRCLRSVFARQRCRRCESRRQTIAA